MNNITLFDLCHDLHVPHIPYSNQPLTWVRWKAEGKDTCIHANGYVSVDYPDEREDYIIVRDHHIVESSVDTRNNLDFDISFLIINIEVRDYKLYFLSIKDNHQLVSGSDTL